MEHLDGNTFRETVGVFGVTTRTLSNREKQYQLTGNLEPSYAKTRLRKIKSDKLSQYVEKHPDAYQYETAKEFECTQQAGHSVLKCIGFIRKRAKGIKNIEELFQKLFYYTIKSFGNRYVFL